MGWLGTFSSSYLDGENWEEWLPEPFLFFNYWEVDFLKIENIKGGTLG